MKVIEIHIKNMVPESPTELHDDLTFQVFSGIQDILRRYRIKCDIDYIAEIPGNITRSNINIKLNQEEVI